MGLNVQYQSEDPGSGCIRVVHLILALLLRNAPYQYEKEEEEPNRRLDHLQDKVGQRLQALSPVQYDFCKEEGCGDECESEDEILGSVDYDWTLINQLRTMDNSDPLASCSGGSREASVKGLKRRRDLQCKRSNVIHQNPNHDSDHEDHEQNLHDPEGY